MNLEFEGETNAVMQDLIYKTVGYPVMSLFTLMNYNIDDNNMPAVIEWAKNNKELNQQVLDISDQKISLEYFVMQHYLHLKKKFVRNNKESVEAEVKNLEEILSQANRFGNNDILRNMIGSRRRLLNLISNEEERI